MLRKEAVTSALAMAALITPISALSADIDPEISVGGGLRTSFTSVENAAPDGESSSSDFNLDSVRLYINGQVTDNIKMTVNTEYDGVEEKVRVLDAIARFEYSDTFNIWPADSCPPVIVPTCPGRTI